MSVLIKGMEMPTSCNKCRFFVDAWCYALDVDDWRNAYNKPPEGERLAGCPLIELPPHGRLIDADALIRQMNQKVEETNNVRYAWVDEMDISLADTIIESEEKDG